MNVCVLKIERTDYTRVKQPKSESNQKLIPFLSVRYYYFHLLLPTEIIRGTPASEPGGKNDEIPIWIVDLIATVRQRPEQLLVARFVIVPGRRRWHTRPEHV